MRTAVITGPDCGRRFLFGQQTCKRTIKHLGLHRDARLMKEATVMWGDNECAPDNNQEGGAV